MANIELILQSRKEDIIGLPQENSTARQNPVTIEKICDEYGERILNMIFRMTGNEEAARDLTQDVLVKVYENLDQFRKESQVFTWIYRIAVNHTLNYLKKEKRHRLLNLLDKNVSDVFQQPSGYEYDWMNSGPPLPDKQVEQSEREEIIWRLIGSLPEKYRIPLMLYRYEELSYQEIADTMNLSLSAVEARIHRARKKLQEKLEPWLKHL